MDETTAAIGRIRLPTTSLFHQQARAGIGGRGFLSMRLLNRGASAVGYVQTDFDA